MTESAQRRYASLQSAVWLTRTQLIVVYCLALSLLMGVAGYGYQQSRRTTEARQLVTHTLMVLKLALELENSAILMESNQRAFLISGLADTLVARDASHDQAFRLAGELGVQVSNNPQQVQRVRQSMDFLQERYQAMQEASAVAARAGLWAAQTHFQARGDGSLEPLRTKLTDVREEQQRLLAERMRIFDRNLARFNKLLIYGASLAFVILIVAGLALLRELGRAERISNALAEAGSRQQASNRELELQAEQLMASNRELESFSYSVSHDLRAPLRHIDGYARMLLEDAADQLQPESQRYLKTIIGSARRMGLLIDDLLAFSRLGRKPLSRQHVNMQKLVESTVDEIKADNAGSSGAPRIDVTTLPSVGGDTALLRQVWANLISNAVKFSAPRGGQAHVVVGGERKGDHMHYWVRDNGVGFDMGYADKLFGVFQRMHPRDQFEGTGVGLAIVQRIVSRHGGQVSATAEVDHGACFSFELPICEREA